MMIDRVHPGIDHRVWCNFEFEGDGVDASHWNDVFDCLPLEPLCESWLSVVQTTAISLPYKSMPARLMRALRIDRESLQFLSSSSVLTTTSAFRALSSSTVTARDAPSASTFNMMSLVCIIDFANAFIAAEPDL